MICFVVMMGMGGFVSEVIYPWIIDSSGSWQVVFAIIAYPSLLVSIIYLFVDYNHNAKLRQQQQRI